MRAQLRGFALIALAIALPAAASADQLVLPSSGLAGLRARRVSTAVARADLGAGLPTQLVAAVRGAELQVSGAASPRVALRSEAFVFPTAASADRVLAAWRRVHRARGAAVGHGGGLALRHAGRGAVAIVAWRENTAVGLIVVRAAAGSAVTLALQFARLEDSNLRIRPPATAWDRVLAQVRDNGSVSKQTALQAFSLAYGPLPGVHPPAGPLGDMLSGDVAQEWIRADEQLGRRRHAAAEVDDLPHPGVPRWSGAATGRAGLDPRPRGVPLLRVPDPRRERVGGSARRLGDGGDGQLGGVRHRPGDVRQRRQQDPRLHPRPPQEAVRTRVRRGRLLAPHGGPRRTVLVADSLDPQRRQR